ncbi:unnamed protein product [Paramecium sonneborni]|uniref:RING-type domain-containing protein n=1 Tax=Paramecium sonneborni TaxID=65129 RepID=A0A8S1RHD2_9CILI|nr:unnamed protein product [Paramecium sonneborni]
MTQQDFWIPRSLMIYSKEEFLNYIDKNQIIFPEYLKEKLLKWNSLPILNFITTEIEASFGSFFCQIIQLSQIQIVRDRFSEFLNKKFSDLTLDRSMELCKFIFQKESLQSFPQSNEFKAIGDHFFESFIYEKNQPLKKPSFYKCLNGKEVNDLNEQDIKYRIVLYQTELNSNQGNLFFSTNNDMTQLKQQILGFYPIYQTPPKNQIKFQTNVSPYRQEQNQINIQLQNVNKLQTSAIAFNNKQLQDQPRNLNPQKEQQEGFIKTSNQQNSNYNDPQNISNNYQGINQNFQQNNYFNNQNNHAQQGCSSFQNNMNQFSNNQNIINRNNQFSQQQQFQQFQQTKIQQPQLQQQQQFQQSQQTKLQQPQLQQQQQYQQQQQTKFQQAQLQQQQQYQQQQQQQQQPKSVKLLSQQNNSNNLQYFQKNSSNSYPTHYIDINQLEMKQKSADEDIFTTQSINSLHENKPQEVKSRLITYNHNNQQTNQECQICCTVYNINSDQAIITPCCSKLLHKECVQQNLHNKVQQNMVFKNIKCFQCDKSLDDNYNFIKQNIPRQLFDEIVKKQVLANIPLKCFSCSLPIDVGQDILYKQTQIECKRCQKKLCSLCRQEYHGQNEQNQQCPSLSREIQKAMKGLPVLVCPFCNLMQTKDDNCNHVRCFGCNKDLCSACSVDRAPIIAHGNHYHRIGCSDYQPWMFKGQQINKEEFDRKKCERCKESQKACQYPISLEEYKKQRNF